MSTLNSIVVNNLSKSYKDKKIINNISFEVNSNDIFSIVGKSGCGKTTIFECILGLAEYEGDIKLSSKVAYTNQKNTLLPWKTLGENFKLISKLNNRSFCENDHVLKSFNLDSLLDMYPGNISGGEKARASIYSTYLTGRKTWLLDEPFSKLDSITKDSIYKWFKKITVDLNVTVLLITHDIDEAISLSTKILTLSDKPTTIKKIFSTNIDKLSKTDIIKLL